MFRFIPFLILLLPHTIKGQTPYEGPYLEAVVKYKFRIGKEKEENPRWGLGFRMDTAGRRYVVIANDGWLTKSEFYYDSANRTTREISLQLATGVKHVYDYNYQWLNADTLQSLRNDYALTTNYIYKNNLLQSVEQIYYGPTCKIINEKPLEAGTPTPDNTTCFERVTFYYDAQNTITGRSFNYYYSQFKALPMRQYNEIYKRNAQGLIDTALIDNDGKYIIMAFRYGKNNRIEAASRRQEGLAGIEFWEFKYKRNGLLKKVAYTQLPDKSWTDKYRWKRSKWKKGYPIIPHLSNFITSHEVKLTEGFYFGY